MKSRGEETAGRPNVLEVDLAAITSNVAILRELVGPGVTIFGAVKANGYGFGLPSVALAMLKGGVDAFAMADPGDAIRIREAGIDVPLLLYGGVLPELEVATVLADYDLICTVGDIEAARAWSQHGIGVKCFLKLDVGLERIGVPAERARAFVEAAQRLSGLQIEGIYTHLHGSDEPGYLGWQLDRFYSALADLEQAGIDLPLRLAESSVTLGLEGRGRCNAVDPGHLLYGFVPVGRPAGPSGIRPAFVSLKTRVIQVKEVERPGSWSTSPVPARPGLRIAVIPLGRADGLSMLQRGEVLVRGQRVPIVGRLSLEHTRLDVTDLPACKAGDEVVVIGPQENEVITPAEVAAHHGLDYVGLTLEARQSVRRVYLDELRLA
jgi:alanine racemase